MSNAGVGATFHITYVDHSSHHVTVTIGDAVRMKMKFGPKWVAEADAADDSSDYLTYIAWLASRHDDTRPRIDDFETFLDLVASVVGVDVPPTPFVEAPPNVSRSSSPSPPTPPPPLTDGSTPTLVTP